MRHDGSSIIRVYMFHSSQSETGICSAWLQRTLRQKLRVIFLSGIAFEKGCGFPLEFGGRFGAQQTQTAQILKKFKIALGD